MSPGGGRPRSEPEVVAAAERYLTEAGFRVYVDPDGTDYFDLVARRGDEVGLVEAKVANSRAVMVQALKRRAWGDWVAVIVGSVRSAERLAHRTDGSRAGPVGVWAFDAGGVRVVRAAAPWIVDGEVDPFAEVRGRLRRLLDGVDCGEIPSAASWDDVLSEVRRASGGRRFAEWRLDEPDRARR